MYSQLKLQPHPFRLLLILEWILLGLSAFKIFGVQGWSQAILFSDTEWLEQWGLEASEMFSLVAILLVFGGMGLRLPTGCWMKWLYVALNFALVCVAGNSLGWGLEALSPLLVVVLLRSSLMFQGSSRWLIAALMWLVYPITLAPVLLVLWFLLKPKFLHSWTFGELASGIAINPDGAVQINLSFNPQQVRQFLVLMQNLILHFLLDNLLSFGLILLFVLLLVNSLINERQGRRKLALANEQLYQYSLQIEDQATLQERTRIARDIHDSLGHLLTAQSIVLENAALALPVHLEEVKGFLNESKNLGAAARTELRQAILMLRSDPLEGKSFEQAIADLITDFKHITTIQTHYRI
ncbi:MAG: histidine kinase, partial [Synechococcales bacterium]|nr:histidine kinase [Synechococcales bacterium]